MPPTGPFGAQACSIPVDLFWTLALPCSVFRSPWKGKSGQRCDTLSFLNVPPDADLSNVTVTVDAIAAQPRAEDYCTIYMPKIQQALTERGIAITLNCADVNGVQTMQIASKPDTMSQEEAEQLVYSDEFYTVKGPWSFTFNLGQ